MRKRPWLPRTGPPSVLMGALVGLAALAVVAAYQLELGLSTPRAAQLLHRLLAFGGLALVTSFAAAMLGLRRVAPPTRAPAKPGRIARPPISLVEERSTRAEMEAVLASTPDALLVLDRDGTVTRYNEMAESLLGLPPLGLSWSDVFAAMSPRDPDGRSLATSRLPPARALRGEQVCDVVLVVTRSAEERSLRVSSAPIRDRGGRGGAVVLLQDLTELSRLQRQQDLFLSIASHEMRGPLSALATSSELLVREASPASEGAVRVDRAQLDQVSRQVERLIALTDHLLDVSRVQSGRLACDLQPRELCGLVSEVAKRLGPVLYPHQLVMKLPDTKIPAVIDAQRLEQVLANLLLNAARYSPEPGPIVLSVHGDEREATVSVADHGVGIEPEEQAKLFQPFFRGASSRGQRGNGLGLYLSRRIIAEHGGRIWVESTPGKGSTFYFTVPLRPQSSSAGTG